MKYKLKKPLPGVEAGAELEEVNGSGSLYIGEKCVVTSYQMRAMEDQGTTNEWLEEVPQEPKVLGQYVPACSGEPFGNTHVVNLHGDAHLVQSLPLRHIRHLANLGLSFETKEECQKWAEWLEARATLMRDTKGFKPNWQNPDARKIYVYWDYALDKLATAWNCTMNEGLIYFATHADADASLRVHAREWKVYLGVGD